LENVENKGQGVKQEQLVGQDLVVSLDYEENKENVASLEKLVQLVCRESADQQVQQAH